MVGLRIHFLAKPAGLPDEIDVGCERKKEIKNDSKNFRLNKWIEIRANPEMGGNTGREENFSKR